MKFEVEASELRRVMKIANFAVEKKTTLPVLTQVLIDADAGTASGTDLDIALQVAMEAKFEGGGKACLPAKKLAEIAQRIDGTVAATVEDNNWLSLRCGSAKFRIPGMASDNFPVIAWPKDPGVALPLTTLQLLAERVSFAISTEESRYTLNAALMEFGDGKATMIATDGHRLVVAEQACEVKKRKPLLIGRAVLNALSLFNGESVQVADDENHIYFLGDKLRMAGRKVTSQFPNYAAVLPKDNEAKISATIPVGEFRSAAERIALVADERSWVIKLELGANGVRLSAQSSDFGDAEETVKAEVSGSLAVGFNVRYLLDVLSHAGGTLTMRCKDDQGAADFRICDGYRCVVMPMRIA